ncbi:biopolymer transporter ExbD [Cobetia marina]|uniref:Biopolymer transporter ExbD n=1 Tax=Cobetia marina TaxID=28258 RepID=A0ABU9GF32_COBMA|nr:MULTISPECIES: biopolymer transporter ExbD [Cobetia]AOM01974.1 biopolymer transporter ExbD [Cobetia marina]AZV31819.1 biopolymer transporter ExbD [Cobetia sp. ICG0124]MDA5563819.1 biopolymer transporter ExbD [Cobetia sp. MMG027]MDH2290488.1 biopolymer transporter ExbD [Cobetia sp. 10Alg 146]MDH2372415.1 biopolymer transporter ExbD [Cobetia sp. 3AK]
MRRRRMEAAEDSGEINLTPMLDVVFIMLIFFIVTTSFVKESGVEIQRPEASHATARPDAAVMVAITAEGAVWVDGKPVDAHRVGDAVAELADGQPVVIQADRQSRTGLLVETMDALRSAGVQDIAVAASKGE